MAAVSLGDLAQSFMLRQHNSSLKQELNRLTTELATGQVADVRDVLAGNYSYLTDIERKTELLSGFAVATSEATHFATAMQAALGRFSDLSQTLSSSLLAARTSENNVNTAVEARSTLDTLIGNLNTDAAGRHLFSGTATDQAPLVDANTLLSELKLALSGATTPTDMINAATAWFDAPTGYTALAYQGANDPLSPFKVSQSEQATVDIRATDPAILKMMQAVAVAALADDPAFALDATAQSELYLESGVQLLTSQDDITKLRANVGFVEAQIDTIAARNAAEVTSLSFAKAELLEVDPFEAATKLEEVQFQLQSLYSVTVRNSQLSLVNFL
jgi:flagellar hook-associated protein 3 FlgL